MKWRRFAALVFAFLLLVSFQISAAADSGDTIVYITRTGECYHRGSCSYLRQSKIEVSLAEAVNRGYRPCSRCSPPQLTRSVPTAAPRQTATPTPTATIPAKSIIDRAGNYLNPTPSPSPSPKLISKTTENREGRGLGFAVSLFAAGWLTSSLWSFLRKRQKR